MEKKKLNRRIGAHRGTAVIRFARSQFQRIKKKKKYQQSNRKKS